MRPAGGLKGRLLTSARVPPRRWPMEDRRIYIRVITIYGHITLDSTPSGGPWKTDESYAMLFKPSWLPAAYSGVDPQGELHSQRNRSWRVAGNGQRDVFRS
jgi:hypothetical protein